MCPYLNGASNKKEPHELFGVLRAFATDLDRAHQENLTRAAKVIELTIDVPEHCSLL
jgi:hypothetical protein